MISRLTNFFKQLFTYYRIIGPLAIVKASKSYFSSKAELVKVTKVDLAFPLFLRVPTSDVRTYKQVFLDQEYSFKVKRQPKIIIDAGANIGLASIYFSSRFPDAKIFAIEPELSNFELLSKNVSSYKNITAIHAALWNENNDINLIDPGLGKWGFMTQEDNNINDSLGKLCHSVKGMRLETIMESWGINHIDILKVDIEGAEKEVFYDTSQWIHQVDCLIVELHERMKPGCNSSFYNGAKGFDSEWKHGENVYLVRNSGCLVSS
jgi:FkbM family methyltransferase